MSRRKQSFPQHLENSTESEVKQSLSPTVDKHIVPEAIDENSISMDQSKVINTESVKYAKHKNEISSGCVDISKVKAEPHCYEDNHINESNLFPEKLNPLHSKPSKTKPSTFRDHTAATRKHKCVDCGISFTNRTTYDVHVAHYCQGKMNKFACKLCDAKFPKHELLKIHAESHMDSNYTCNLCGASFVTPIECEMHMAGHVMFPNMNKDASSTLSCPGCGDLCKDEADLMLHMWMKHVVGSAENVNGTMHKKSTNELQPTRENKLYEEAPFEDGEVNISTLSPLITSTPTRPLSADAPSSMFTCIVCKSLFTDVVHLQRHLLAAHSSRMGSVLPNKTSKAEKLKSQNRHHVDGDLSAKKRNNDAGNDSMPPKRSKMEVSKEGDKLSMNNDRLEGYCLDCCIPFRVAGNYRAHKQFYCASRHRNAKLDDNLNDDKTSQNNQIKQRKELSKKSKRADTSKNIQVEYEDKKPFRSGLIPSLPTKKFFCQECNVGFSQQDTYLAHKTYYCESRRKDKDGSNEVENVYKEPNSSKSSPQPPIIPDNLEEAMASYINGVQMSQFQAFKNLLSLPGSSPNTKLDMFNPLSQMLMNPLLLNQYMSLFQNNNFLDGNSNEEKPKPLKVSPGSMSEPNGHADDESHRIAKRPTNAPRSLSTSPLDLSRKAGKLNREFNGIVFGADGNPCPSIDLRKTSFKFNENINGNNNNVGKNHKNKYPSKPRDSPNSDGTELPTLSSVRSRHCKNCHAHFTNLSTFVAHKKFYCPGITSSETSTKTVLPKATLAH